MDKVREYFKNDRLAQHLGMEIVDVAPGRSTIKMEVRDCHMNSLRMVHGGSIFALADFAFAVAGNSHGTVAVAINTSMSFVKAARVGTLYANARETSLNPKLATYTIDVTDEDGDLVATMTGMVYKKKDTLEEARQKGIEAEKQAQNSTANRSLA